MKYLITFLCTVIVAMAWGQEPDPDFNDKQALVEGRSYLKTAGFIEAADAATYDLVHQHLILEADPALHYIAGKVISRVKLLEENLAELYFDLSNALTVDSVLFNQARVVYQHANDRIKITLPASLALNSVHETQVFYHGAPPQTGFGSFMVSTHNDEPILWTLSEPYGAHDWWPCKESLKDKIDSIDITVTCPEQYRVASNGKLILDEVSDQKRTMHWRHRYPVATYLVAIAVTNYESFSDFVDAPDGKKIEILNYVYPEYLATAKTKSEEITSIMDFYNTRLITYPFADEKYGHAQFGWGGGMEHQTMSFMSGLHFDLVAHEMAHQWFGDYITLASWHDIWLNEGFATYMTGLVYETLKEGFYWPIWKTQHVTRITSAPDGSVYVPDTTDVSRIFNGRLSYSKGGYLLHMLRWEMGDEPFFRALKNYLSDPALAYGKARQQDLVRHMEQAADTSFTEFFNDWYYGEGYPSYHIRQLSLLGSNGGQMIQVTQVPSHPSVSFFEMHLPIRVWKNGQSTVLRLYNNVQDQQFELSASAIDSLQFDPEKWLIAKADRITGIEELPKKAEIKIFTEATGQRLRVKLPEASGKGTLRLIDLSGRTVMETTLQRENAGIDISSLKAGVYIVEVKTNKETRKEKIIVGR